MNSLLRVYYDPAEIGADGYPHAWHRPAAQRLIENSEPLVGRERVISAMQALGPFPMSIKDFIRERDGHRCLRCGHPYRKGEHGRGEWSPCDEECRHGGPTQSYAPDGVPSTIILGSNSPLYADGWRQQAQWRILTVHHLNGIKHDCRWWNLVSLCQRCHLTIQGKVYMDRPWPKPHSDWFKPFAAGFYAWKYLDEEITQDQALERIDELLLLELTQDSLF